MVTEEDIKKNHAALADLESRRASIVAEVEPQVSALKSQIAELQKTIYPRLVEIDSEIRKQKNVMGGIPEYHGMRFVTISDVFGTNSSYTPSAGSVGTVLYQQYSNGAPYYICHFDSDSDRPENEPHAFGGREIWIESRFCMELERGGYIGECLLFHQDILGQHPAIKEAIDDLDSIPEKVFVDAIRTSSFIRAGTKHKDDMLLDAMHFAFSLIDPIAAELYMFSLIWGRDPDGEYDDDDEDDKGRRLADDHPLLMARSYMYPEQCLWDRPKRSDREKVMAMIAGWNSWLTGGIADLYNMDNPPIPVGVPENVASYFRTIDLKEVRREVKRLRPRGYFGPAGEPYEKWKAAVQAEIEA